MNPGAPPTIGEIPPCTSRKRTRCAALPLNAVTGIVERRHTLPILANVLIEKRGNALSLLATDLEIQITTAKGRSGRRRFSADHLRQNSRTSCALPDGATVTLDQQDASSP